MLLFSGVVLGLQILRTQENELAIYAQTRILTSLLIIRENNNLRKCLGSYPLSNVRTWKYWLHTVFLSHWVHGDRQGSILTGTPSTSTCIQSVNSSIPIPFQRKLVWSPANKRILCIGWRHFIWLVISRQWQRALAP